MKLLIADKFGQPGVEELRACGCVVTLDASLSGDALQEAIASINPEVLIVRGTRVTAEMLTASEKLGVVVRAGAGVNTIDTEAASRRSILVANCPGKNAVAVAELTLALILALDRRLVENVIDLRNGSWNKKEYTTARGLKGRTLGLIGTGGIGRAVASRALAMEMNVLAWSRSLTEDRAEALGVGFCASPADVASQCDILSLHVAAMPDTKNLISADVLDRLKPGSYVINTARAEVMDYAALARAVEQKGVRVGLDVYPHEPAGGQGRFADTIIQTGIQAGGVVYGTHHIGASTDQSQEAIARETIRIVRTYVQTGRVENCVNLCADSPGRFIVVVRHRNRPGVLAHTLNAISHAGVNVEEMENVICDGAESACAQIKLDGPLTGDVLAKIKQGNEHVFAVSFTAPEAT